MILTIYVYHMLVKDVPGLIQIEQLVEKCVVYANDNTKNVVHIAAM